jgi:hypothetical protein
MIPDTEYEIEVRVSPAVTVLFAAVTVAGALVMLAVGLDGVLRM